MSDAELTKSIARMRKVAAELHESNEPGAHAAAAVIKAAADRAAATLLVAGQDQDVNETTGGRRG